MRKRRTVLLSAVGIVCLVSGLAQAAPDALPHVHAGGLYVSNASDFVSAADWNSMQTVRIEIEEFTFTPEALTFAAGQPYKLEIVNIGTVKHYFTAEEFYRYVAFRKAQTSEGEYKAPYFKAVEVFPGDQVDLYFVPVIPGVYDSTCTIAGHHDAGMHGTITVTGETPSSPAPIMAVVREGDWVQNAGDLVSAADWGTMQTIRVDMAEFTFTPEDLTLVAGQPYKLEIANVGDVKHYFTAEEFYQSVAFRKAQDNSGEIKAPYFKAVEIFPGQQADLYLIPTKAGTYDSTCTITGHEDAGMHGHITVAPAASDTDHVHPGGTYVANASDFVSAVDWVLMQTITVEMAEFTFAPENLVFDVGRPYKLEIVNVGAVKHYFTAEGFYRSVAFRKAQTSEGEYKAPYFKAIEVFPGDQVDLYFVPVIPGAYDSTCTITGHHDAGMHGHITVTGETPSSPAPVMATVAEGNWVQNAGELVSAADWGAMQTVRVEMAEFAFAPETVVFSVGQPYKLEIVNLGDVKHYFTAEGFYRSVAFRKAQDNSGEIKAPYFKAVEVFPGQQADLYLIPTKVGTYDSTCTITGHEDAGMHGHILVTE